MIRELRARSRANRYRRRPAGPMAALMPMETPRREAERQRVKSEHLRVTVLSLVQRRHWQWLALDIEAGLGFCAAQSACKAIEEGAQGAFTRGYKKAPISGLSRQVWR